MKVKLIFPRWEKLPFQTPFHLAPLGLPTLAGHFPPEWDVELVDENVDPLDLDDTPDWVGVSLLLTAQARRGYEIADAYRARGVPVVLGGIHTALMPELAEEHADAVVDGEVEGVWEELRADLERGTLKKRYTPEAYPSLENVPGARRDLLNRARYEVRGVKMFDLVQATRGCTYNCYPCCVPKLRGTAHRVRPVAEVIDEVGRIDNDRVFFVDNCLRQNDTYQREFFTALKDLNLAWVAHPISEEDDILRLAREAGAWYIYQAIDRISDTIRDRIRRFHDHGIGVEGTILLGRDSHDRDFFKRMVDFLLELEVELVEFTILTPFPNLGLFRQLERDGRILHRDWDKYNTANAVFQPALMSPEELEEGYRWSWETFYREEPQRARMARMHLRAMADLKRRGA
jgi:radical SAM superfamily enzyme YgiQ (UPF0313 family)